MVPVHGAGDGDGGRWGGAATPGGSLNEQIVVALARLQDDMKSVLERLHTLEALTASQVSSICPLKLYVQRQECLIDGENQFQYKYLTTAARGEKWLLN